MVMAPLPKKIKVALANTLPDWEIASIERYTADGYLAVFEDDFPAIPDGLPRIPADYETDDEYDGHIRTLAGVVRKLLAADQVDAAVHVAIHLGELLVNRKHIRTCSGSGASVQYKLGRGVPRRLGDRGSSDRPGGPSAAICLRKSAQNSPATKRPMRRLPNSAA
jgi:hypothetical protein